MHLVSFVESFHRVHLIPRNAESESYLFIKIPESESRTYTLLSDFYVFVAVPYNFVRLDCTGTYTSNLNCVCVIYCAPF